MKYLVNIARFIVGIAFIFSGIVKTIDPIGFSYKLEEYFSPSVLNVPFLEPFSLPIAIFIVIFEIILGVLLLLGIFKKFTVYNLLILILFFTFLTFYAAFYDKVKNCGCYGDFIKLKPWETFSKDVLLTILIGIILIGIEHINPIHKNIKELKSFLLFSIIVSVYIAYQGISHLPIVDYRPYAEGKSLIEGRKSAEELGLKPPKMVTVYTYINTETKEEIVLDSDSLMNTTIWEDPKWELDSLKTKSNVIVEDGYEPPIPVDFSISCENEDKTEEILNYDKVVIITVIHPKKIKLEELAKIRKLVNNLTIKKIKYKIVSTENKLANLNICILDEKVIKAINRSEVGVMLLKKGIVRKKYHYNDFPSIKLIQDQFNK